jgi:propionyl-CoA carboxylase alpha chain
MYIAAASLARAIGYVGAGTVEFLVADSPQGQEFFFLEMNTRLQVEHPVTEAVTGLDLVEWQIRVARGEMLPLTQGEITRRGHAIEVRLYAEDPAHGYLPNTGTLERFEVPAGLRLDSGVESGSEVSSYYDPMLAKIVAHASDRLTAASAVARGLRASTVHGLITNRESLVAIVESEAFRGGETTTAFLDRHPEVLAPEVPAQVADRHAVAVAMDALGVPGAVVDGVPAGWRNVPAVPEVVGLERIGRDGLVQVAVTYGRSAPVIDIIDGDGDPWTAPRRSAGELQVRPDGIVLNGLRVHCEVARYGDLACVDDGLWSTQWHVRPRFRDVDAEGSARGPSTPVPGTITMVEVAVGDVVREGQVLVVLEAMKMEHRILAEGHARVSAVHVAPGDAVDAHAVVVELEPIAEES